MNAGLPRLVRCRSCGSRVRDDPVDRTDHAVDDHGAIDASAIKYDRVADTPQSDPIRNRADAIPPCDHPRGHAWVAHEFSGWDIRSRRCKRCGYVDAFDGTERTEADVLADLLETDSAPFESEAGYILEFGYHFGKSPTGGKVHLILEGPPSVLVRGSPEDEMAGREKAFCGTVSAFETVEAPDPDAFCQNCQHRLQARHAVVGGGDD